MTPAQAQKIKEALPRLSEQDRIEAQKLLDEWSKRRRQRKFFSMYPDKGPHSRGMYPKHMEFMFAGTEFRERCFMAANRCLVGDVLVDTDKGPVQASVAFGSEDYKLKAWDADQQREVVVPSGPKIEVGVAKTKLVQLSNDAIIQCSHDHMMLTVRGWVTADELAVGDICPDGTGGVVVMAVVEGGEMPVIDTQIANYHNYKAGGVYHHNCGKTVTGSYETVCHLTGRYPDWWDGYKFSGPVKFWAAGDTAKTVRDIIQVELLGNHNEHGTGMIPGEDIVKTTPKAGVPDAVDTIYVKHYDDHGDQDGISQLGLKSYDQGRIAFQGTEQDGIWLDEECPMDVYTECLIRTMTTNGLIYLTFTPLKGLTDVVMSFMPKGTEEVFGG